MSDYLKGAQENSVKISEQKSSSSVPDIANYPKFEFKVDTNFPIKILDSMIQAESYLQNGFTLYNRGNTLKKSLISADKVKAYLSGETAVPKGPPKLPGCDVIETMLQDDHLDDDKQWRLMMDYFKENPAALMDALPTPKGSEEEARTGLTPKKGFTY